MEALNRFDGPRSFLKFFFELIIDKTRLIEWQVLFSIFFKKHLIKKILS